MAEVITSRDFAAGYYLKTDMKGAVYSLELPEDVYRTVKSSDLKDVRVFNGAGEVVPHDFRIVKTDPTTLRDKETIPFFPLTEANTTNDLAGFSLQVSRNNTGAIVNIKSAPTAYTADQKINGYLLDLSNLKQAASELEFQWEKDIGSSVFTVNIQQSSDLVHWAPLVHKATLADLQFGGQQVDRKTILLPRQPLEYLKLTWLESRRPLRITAITGFSRVIEARKKHRWISLYNETVSKKNDQLMVDFATSYRLPTSRIQIRFPEINSIARLSVQSRSDVDTGWWTHCEQVFYDLSFEGAVIQNEPCVFPPTDNSLWRVVVKQDGAGLQRFESRAISMQLGWQPSELLFVARGSPPYLLAFGSGKFAQQDKKPDGGMILQAIKKESPALSLAKLGKRISLGGEAALQSPAQPAPWKKWLLWAVLVLGVGLLAFMARNLTKELKTAEEKQVSDEG